jgi:hypothetical protein
MAPILFKINRALFPKSEAHRRFRACPKAQANPMAMEEAKSRCSGRSLWASVTLVLMVRKVAKSARI